MYTYEIFTDSSCDLGQDWIQKYSLHVLQLDVGCGVRQIVLIIACVVALAYCIVVLHSGKASQVTGQNAVLPGSMHTACGVAVAYVDGTTVVSARYTTDERTTVQ